jgi:hypothetical protein
MAGCSCSDWLEDFVAHTSYGEAPEHIMYWVGVSTIAGALRRKVWIDEFNFQWTPNFFILLIGPPGVLKKSTSSGLGMRILEQVEGIDFGPNEITWPQLVAHMGEHHDEFDIPGRGKFITSCTTFAISEFGTFFDPDNRPLIDGLTDLWDSKLGTFKKETKTAGKDIITNPWLNMIAGTTQGWLDDNFSEKFVRSGFASRLIYVACTETKRRAYPSDDMPPEMWENETNLAIRLAEIAQYSGPFRLTAEAKEFGRKWYDNYRNFLDKCKEDEMGLYSRAQTHLHKLAMVISAAKGHFPVVDVHHMIEADRKLASLEKASTVFGRVGQTPQSKLAMDVLEILTKHGKMTKRELYAKFFFRTVSANVFEEALKSVKAGGLVRELGDVMNPVLEVV